MRALIQDLRFGFRILAGKPGFTIIAVLTLALGIAATSTVFSWTDSILLHPYPGVSMSGGELAAFEMNTATAPNGGHQVSYPDYREYRDRLKLISGLALHRQDAFNLGNSTTAQLVWGELVSPNYFDVLGARLVLGRGFSTEAEDAPGGSPAVVISERLWRTRLSADPAIIGKPIHINRHPLTVVGVVRGDFRGTVPAFTFDVWVPMNMAAVLGIMPESMYGDRGHRYCKAVARLKPGVSLKQASAEAAAVASELAAAYPKTNRTVSATFLPVWLEHDGPAELLVQPLGLLMIVSALVLLIVCANVANLLLSRSVARRKEFGIRVALGAARTRIARQILTETLVLAVAGAVVSIPMVLWMAESLPSLTPSVGLPVNMSDYNYNWRIFGFTALACLLSALIAGAAPAAFSLRADVNETLKDGGRTGTAGVASHRTRNALVIAEVALAVVALAGAGLFVRSFQKLRAVDTGFDSSNVLFGRFFIESTGYDAEQTRLFSRRLRDHLLSTPGMKAVAYSDFVPLAATAGPWITATVPGYTPAPGEVMSVSRSYISPGYFAALGTRLLDGRDFTDLDRAGAPPVIIVNETFATRYFGGRNPIGRTVRMYGLDFTIVGLARDMKYFSPAEAPRPFLYAPFQQFSGRLFELDLFVRTQGDPLRAVPAMRRAVLSVDPNGAAFHTVTLAEYTQVGVFTHKVAASLTAALGIMCLILAALGLYSVLSNAIAQRTQELGIRIAMGAKPSDVIAMVLRQGLTLTAIGAVVGMMIAFAASRLIATMLFQVHAADPITFVAAPLVLGCVALLAAWIPARRATKVDPMVALRQE